jgi:hypothetical protein
MGMDHISDYYKTDNRNFPIIVSVNDNELAFSLQYNYRNNAFTLNPAYQHYLSLLRNTGDEYFGIEIKCTYAGQELL